MVSEMSATFPRISTSREMLKSAPEANMCCSSECKTIATPTPTISISDNAASQMAKTVNFTKRK